MYVCMHACMHACVDVWGAWYVWHRCRNRGMLVTVRGIIYYMARTVLAWLFIMPPALATGGDHWGGRPWPQGGTVSWLICIYIYIWMYNNIEWFWMRDLLQLLLPLAFQCHVKGHLQYEFPRFWDMYMSSDSSILTPGQLPDWQISKGFNRYERLKLLRCLWMHPTTLAELSLCAPWLIQLVLLVHHSTDVALWTDACEACQSGPLRSAQGAIGPVAHNHQGLLVRVLGIHQLMDIDGYWWILEVGDANAQNGKWISPPSTNMHYL